MLGKTHKYVGACCGIVAAEFFAQKYISPENVILGGMIISSSFIGSLLPDIDHKKSIMGQKYQMTSSFISSLFGHRGITHAPLVWGLLCLLILFANNIVPTPARLAFIFCFMFGSVHRGVAYICKLVCKKSKGGQLLSSIIGISCGALSCGYLYNMDEMFLYTLVTFTVVGLFIGAMSHVLLDSLTPKGTPWLYPVTKKKFRLMKLSDKYGFMVCMLFTIVTSLSTYYVYFK